MPKDRKRKNMLIITCIMLFAILFTLVPAFSFSVTAARRNTGRWRKSTSGISPGFRT